METTRNFVSFAVTDLKGKNDQINFITQFTLCIEKLPTKQHIYAYLLFVLMKKDYITLVNSILTDVLILLTKLFVNETDLIVFKNVLKFLCDCVNAYVFPLQSLSTIYNKLLLHVENQPRSAHSDSVAYLIITSITFLKNTEYRTTIMNKVKTYVDSTSSITHLKYHQIFLQQEQIDFIQKYINLYFTDSSESYFKAHFDFMALEEKPEQPLEVPFSLENNFTLTGWYNPQFLSFGTNSNNNFIDIVIQDKLFDIIQVLHSDANLLLSYSQCCAPSEFIDFETITKAIFSVFLSGVQSHSYLYYTVLSRMVLFLEPTFKPITLTEIYLMNHLDELCGSSIIRFVHYLSNKYINLNYEFKEQIWKIYEESYKDNEIYKFFFTSFFSDLSLFDIRKTEADVSSPTLRQFIKEVAFNCPDIYGDIRRIKEDFEISVTNNESAEDIFESLASSYDETNIEKVSLYIALEKSEQSVSKLDEFITRFKSWLEKWISSGSNAIECCNIIFSAWQNSPIDLMIVFKRFVYHQLLDRSIVIDYILEKIKLPDLNIHYIDLLIELCNCDCPNSSDIKMKVITELVGCIAPLDNGQTQKQILEGFLVYFVQSVCSLYNISLSYM